MAFFGIRGGGGGAKVLSGTSVPSASVGNNGDMYLKIGMKGALLHFDDDATTDENDNIWNTNGSPIVSADHSKFGGKSLYLNGSSYLQSAVSSDAFNFGKNDFTISCWIYPTTTGRKAVFAMSADLRIGTDILYGQGSANMWLSSNGSRWNILQSDNSGTNTGQGTIAININKWTHIAYVRNGTNVRMYVNGQIAKEVTLSSADVSVYWSGNDGFRIGAWGNSSYKYTGYIDEFLVLNGMALWTDTFTPPTQAFDIADFSNVITDTYAKVNGIWQPLVGTDINDISI